MLPTTCHGNQKQLSTQRKTEELEAKFWENFLCKHCVVSRLPKTCFEEASGEDGLPCLVITKSILVPRKDVGIYAGSLCINGCPESTTKTPAVKLACSSAPQIQASRITSPSIADPITSYLKTIFTKYSEIRPNIRFDVRCADFQLEKLGKTKNLQRTCRCSQSLICAAKLTNHAMSLQNPADSSKNAMEHHLHVSI